MAEAAHKLAELWRVGSDYQVRVIVGGPSIEQDADTPHDVLLSLAADRLAQIEVYEVLRKVVDRADPGAVASEKGDEMTFPPESEFRYRRAGDLVRLQTHGMTNHELRTVMVGMWLSLNAEDRVDFLEELLHYSREPDSEPPGASVAIAEQWKAARERV